MTVDRTPKPCFHKIANHQHGQRNAYVLDRCRCLPCAYAASVYELDRSKRNAYGRPNYIDADPARQHVAALMAAGVGLKRIAVVSGVPQGALWKLVYGKKRPDGTQTPSRRVIKATAGRLLALDPADPTLLADGAKTTSVGTGRRLQALTRIGWSIGRLANEAGVDRQRLDAAIGGHTVVASTVRAVAALYERLWDQQPPASNQRERISVSRSINRAAAAGWPPPMAWDDDTIDDPAVTPDLGDDVDQVDELAVDAVLDGHRLQLTGMTLHAAVHALAGAGHQPAAIADRLDVHVRQVERLRARDDAPRAKRPSAAA